MRIEPPPSLAWATGTIPLATAAAEPPEEPPVVLSVFQGLRVGPYARGSVVIVVPNSGQFVRPRMMQPAACSASVMKLSVGAR
jgi:hypothetical protein